MARIRRGRAAASGQAVPGGVREGSSAPAPAERDGPGGPDAGGEDSPERPETVLQKAGDAFELLVSPLPTGARGAFSRRRHSTFRVKQRDTDKAHSLFGTSEGTGLVRTVRSAFDCSDRREFMENGDRLLSPAVLSST